MANLTKQRPFRSDGTYPLRRSGQPVPSPQMPACNGFKNLGQCVAAAHVAKNLRIPGGFDALKAKMTGGNGTNLGKAIQSFDLHVDPKAETKKANKQANDDLKETS